jgi:hypothetical protein
VFATNQKLCDYNTAIRSTSCTAKSHSAYSHSKCRGDERERCSESVSTSSPSIKSSRFFLETCVALYVSTETGREGLRWTQADSPGAISSRGIWGMTFFHVLSWSGQYNLPLCMSFREITESFRRLAQWIPSIDDRCNFASLQNISQKS